MSDIDQRKLSSTAERGIEALMSGSFSAELSVVRDSLRSLSSDPTEVARLLSQSSDPSTLARLDKYLGDIGALTGDFPKVANDIDAIVRAAQRYRLKVELAPVPSIPAGITHEREPLKIDPSKIVVVTKLTKIEYDMQRLNCSYEELMKLYTLGGEDIKRIIDSHNRQIEGRATLSTIFKPEQILARDSITKKRVAGASAVIAWGGDNHCQYVSHFIDNDLPLLGVNSDSVNSYGALLACFTNELPEVLRQLEKADYKFRPWTRLNVTVDGQPLPLATCDLFLGESERKYMSRHTLEIQDGDAIRKMGISLGHEKVEQKSSGLIVTTGAGSTGWYKSAGRYLYPEGHVFPPESLYARFLLTEISGTVVDEDGNSHKIILPPLAEGVLLPGQKMIVKSLNDSKGIVTSDSLEEIDFYRGKTAVIEVAEKPLWAIGLK